jgi:hypothetical protein
MRPQQRRRNPSSKTAISTASTPKKAGGGYPFVKFYELMVHSLPAGMYSLRRHHAAARHGPSQLVFLAFLMISSDNIMGSIGGVQVCESPASQPSMFDSVSAHIPLKIKEKVWAGGCIWIHDL